MPFTPGTPKPAGSGRKKGTLNKLSMAAIARLSELGIDPFHELKKIAKQTDNEELRARIYMAMCEYLYPKRKAIEHSGIDGGPITVTNADDAVEALRARVARIAERERAAGILPITNPERTGTN